VRLLGWRNEMIVSGSSEQRIGAIARHQRGRASRDQLIAAGLSAGAIQRRVRRGSLIREHPSVYVVGHVPAAPFGPETAALLSVRDGAVLSHHSAAALWAIGPPDPGGQVHILLKGGWAGRRRGVRIHRTAVLDTRDIRVRHGLPVTSPARTLLDQAGLCAERQLERLFTEAIVQHLVTPADLEAVVAQGRGRTGRRVLRALLDDELDPTLNRSDGEKRMMALIRMAQLPEPIVYAKLYGFEADFYWPAHRVVVEVDSYGFHTTRWAYERDRRKDAVLRAHGLAPLRFSWRQITEDPFVVIAQVAQAIARGGAPPA
jgi:very-short-patch-repair endonuclease